MSKQSATGLTEMLNGFAEIMSSLMTEQFQRHLAEMDLTLLQAQLLRILRQGPRPTGQLAAALHISPPAVTQLTDRLIRKGLIERQTSPTDRRAVLIALSTKGRRLEDKFRERRGQIMSNALALLEEDRQEQIMAALEELLHALRKYESTVIKN